MTDEFMSIFPALRAGLLLGFCFIKKKKRKEKNPESSECTSISCTQIHQQWVSNAILSRLAIHTHIAAESRTRSAVEPPCSLPSCRSDAFHCNSVLVGGPDVWWQANASLILRHRGRLFLSLQTMTLPST